MTALSNERLLLGAMTSTVMAAASPTIWSVLSPDISWDVYTLASWFALTVLMLLVGACVSFLVLWPTALLLQGTRFPVLPGVVLGGTLAWPAMVGILFVVKGGSVRGFALLGLLGAAIGFVTSAAFAVVAGARREADRSSPELT